MTRDDEVEGILGDASGGRAITRSEAGEPDGQGTPPHRAARCRVAEWSRVEFGVEWLEGVALANREEFFSFTEGRIVTLDY